jgi:hypothetical protein
MKSEAEVSAYFHCYHRNDGGEERYLIAYRPKLRLASRNFNVSNIFSSCLVYRESFWDPNANGKPRTKKAKTYEHAVGLAQTRPNAASEINRRLADRDPAFRKSWVQTLKTFSDIIPGTELDQAIGDGGDSIEVINRRIRNLNLPPPIDSTHSLSPLPLDINVEMLTESDLSIAAGAAYLNAVSDVIHHEFSKLKIANQPSGLDYNLILAAAYNMGPTAFGSRLGKAIQYSGKNPQVAILSKDWMARMDLSIETQTHIRSLRNCMEKGNWSPPNGTDNTPTCDPQKTNAEILAFAR